MSELLGVLGPFASILSISVIPFIAILTRLSAMMFLLPGVGMRIIPVRVKVALVLALSFLLLPIVGDRYLAETTMVPLFLGEALAGLFLGFSARVFIFILSIVGAIVAQSLSLSQIFGAGISEEANTTISTMLTMAGAVIFLSLDLHVVMIGIAVQSVDAFPPGAVLSPVSVGAIAETVLAACGQGLALALALSLPFLLLNLAYNTLLGVLNRAMPQLMVTFVGLPAITLSGLVLLFSGVSGTLTLWLDAVLAGLDQIIP